MGLSRIRRQLRRMCLPYKGIESNFGDDIYDGIKANVDFVSIHAPTRGATAFFTISIVIRTYEQVFAKLPATDNLSCTNFFSNFKISIYYKELAIARTSLRETATA